jgi:hypothetical protein
MSAYYYMCPHTAIRVFKRRLSLSLSLSLSPVITHFPRRKRERGVIAVTTPEMTTVSDSTCGKKRKKKKLERERERARERERERERARERERERERHRDG